MYKVRIKNNGVVSISDKLVSDLKKEGVIYGNHLCNSKMCICKNATALNCPKIAEFNKKNIGKFDFITDGYQVLSDNKDEECFIVTGCKNYVEQKDFQTKISAERYRRIVDGRINLLLGYYGVDTIEEIEAIQEHNSHIK